MNSHLYEILLALGVLSPFVSFWLLVFFGPKLGKPAAGWLGVFLGMFVPLCFASYVLFNWWLVETPETRAALTEHAFRFDWARLGDIPIRVGVKLDSLTVGMYFMVTFIATWIFVFSVGYMSGHSDEVAHQSKYHRFFAYLSLFGFSMLGLVISSSLMFLFIFWELVGLCSYLLIGYYFDQRVPQYAQMKAFITNRVGDFGFLIGLMLVFFQLGTLELDQAAINFAKQHAAFVSHDMANAGIFASDYTFLGWSLATIMGIGLFCGAMGKSAQFPLHVWLPDAMAGPTPVSALIHAATMVAAGVYLVARVFPLMTPDALMFVATIGCITLFLMALIAIVQTDIKKCLAYSTLSQLGYMIFGMGCGAWIAALFHLITHAFFKAMMFLGSGQVIEGCHHEQDMRKMGGLRKKMPVTCWTFFIGVLAIAGTGIPGLVIAGHYKIGLGGFFSKDEILAVAWTRAFAWDDPKDFEVGHGEHHATNQNRDREGAASGGTDSPKFLLASDPAHSNTKHEANAGTSGHGEAGHGTSVNASIFAGMKKHKLPKWMFYLAIATAYITPFYMMRAWWLTFMGKPRDHHVYDHAHESPLMFIPLAVLAVGTFFSSYFLFRPLIVDASTAATVAPMVMSIDGEQHSTAITHAHQWLIYGVGGAFLVGFFIAFLIYRNGLELAESIKQKMLPIHTLLERKYYIDELYHLVWVKGCLALAYTCRFFDTYVVDLIFDTLAASTERFAAFSGLIVDAHGVDGVINGVAKSSMDFAGVVRSPQTGRIRNYVLFTAGIATIVIICALLFWTQSGQAGVTEAGR